MYLLSINASLKFLVFILLSFGNGLLEGRFVHRYNRHRVQRDGASLGEAMEKMEKDSATPSSKFLDHRRNNDNEDHCKERPKEERHPIETALIVAKHNRDFEYFSTILRSMKGKGHRLNCIGDNEQQRYILRAEEKDALQNRANREKMSGVYAVIILNESLEHWMGKATITLEYIRYGSLRPYVLHFPIEVRPVSDKRQIFIFLDPVAKHKKKFIAWKVTFHDVEHHVSHSMASFAWETLTKKR
ncbi:MAG: hypothetical protein LBB11_02215 [Puniceicoccales bacterium]|jgi:hypothetical protein|nr:hypothetical protein [Puniceicoccales bacterium]